MPITERYSVGDVRRAANEYAIPYGVDPFVFRLAFPNFNSVKNLRDRAYAPVDRLTPYQPDDLRALEEARRVAHGAIDEQQQGGADFFLAASFAIRDLDDKWLVRNAKLLDLSLGQASAYGKPLVATLELPLEALASPEAQIRLANRIARGRPSALLVNFDRLEAGAAPAQLYWALRMTLLLQDSGAPVLLGRAGALRHFFLAFGLGGFEDGLGRYIGFRVSDFNGERKPFGAHGPRFEFPSLLKALPPDRAVAVLASGIVPEATCECRACVRAGSPRDQVAAAYLHNAEMLKREGQALATLAPAERVARLEEAIAKGLLLDRELQRREIWRRRLAHLESFREAVALARPLLDVERLARRAA